MKIIITLFGIFMLVILWLWQVDIAKDQENIVKVNAPVQVFDDWECGYSNQKGCEPIFQLPAGSEYDVQRIRYRKDFMAIKVENTNQSGWLIRNEDITVIRKHGT